WRSRQHTRTSKPGRSFARPLLLPPVGLRLADGRSRSSHELIQLRFKGMLPARVKHTSQQCLGLALAVVHQGWGKKRLERCFARSIEIALLSKQVSRKLVPPAFFRANQPAPLERNHALNMVIEACILC